MPPAPPLSGSSTPGDGPPAGYRAFISYSHADIRVAKRIHRQLESYRVPARLVGRVTRTGLVGKSIGKLFRDRDELSVSADLSGKINLALRESQFLIVLCSVASARSRWVNQEIINFKRLKGAESIIAVIVNGEPFSSNTPGREGEECFPPALRFEVDPAGELTSRPAEPVAADLRPGKDGPRLVKMKVLAGLLGVELDELIKREVQRRNRQLFALSCVMGAIVAAMGILSILAVNSRNEAVAARDDAQRQRVQAEGLIDFMLGDLRDKLRPVGRLDSLEAVGERAAGYFESLKPDEIDAETRARLARAKLLSGEVFYSQGKAQAAAEQFDQAYAMTAALFQAEPQNPGRIFDHAQSEYWVGYGNYRNARYAEAERSFIAYRALAEDLVNKEPGNLAWEAELASALTNLGAVRIRLLRYAEAAEDFRLANQRQTLIIAAQPPLTSLTDAAARAKQQAKLVDLNLSLGQILAWEADAELGVGRIDAAITLRERELGIYRQVEELDPKNASMRQAHWVAFSGRGTLFLEKGEPAAALADFEAAIGIADALTRLDAENKRWAQLLARAHLNAADALLDLERFDESRQRIDFALARGREIASAPNINRSVRTELLGRALLASAQAHAHTQSYGPARSALSELASLLDNIAADTPGDAGAALLRVEAEILAGDLEAGQARADTANAHWRAASEIARKVGAGSNVRLQVLSAEALRRLDNQQEFSAAVQTVCAGGYRRGAFKQLCR